MGFFLFCFMALGFWPLYLGRVSVQSALMVPWECATFFVLVQYLNPPPKSRPLVWLLLLAALTAAGFYIYLAWPLVAGMVALALLFHSSESLEN